MVFSVSAQTYRLEIWDTTRATHDSGRNTSSMEDLYVLVRSASGTTSRSLETKLSIEQVRQKIQDISGNDAGWRNFINNDFVPTLQRRGFNNVAHHNGARTVHTFVWVRRDD